MKSNEPVDLDDCHLVVETTLRQILNVTPLSKDILKNTEKASPNDLKDILKAYEDRNSYRRQSEQSEYKVQIEELEKRLKEIYETKKVKIGETVYDIVLKPFYDGYHGNWVRVDLRGFDLDSEIYLVVTPPKCWNDFRYTLACVGQLGKDSNDLFDELDVFYVIIPWASQMHRWD